MLKTHNPNSSSSLVLADPLAARFCQYFSYPWRHIFAPVSVEPGEKLQWHTAKYFLDARTLWRRHQDPDTMVGLRFGDETPYCLLDIDRGSPYHPANDPAGFKAVKAALEEIGLCRPLVVQSSDSGGVHVYFFLASPVPTFALACAIKFALEDAGFRLRCGQLEAFPNTKAWGSYYNGHRLPLQLGSYLLDDDQQPLTSDLALFLDAADTAAANQDLIALQFHAEKAKIRYKPRRIGGLPEDHAQWKRDWEEQIATGWTGHGQTNVLLQIIVGYGMVWEGLSGSALEDWAVDTATKAPGYEQYCRHQHEIRLRVRDWIRSSDELNNYYSPYRSWPRRLGSFKKVVGDAVNTGLPFKTNSERSEQAQNRIKQVVSLLEAAGTLPKMIIARIKAIIVKAKEVFSTSISHKTLSKHLTLWHPKHYKSETVLQEEPLPCDDSSEIPTPPPCSTGPSSQLESLEPSSCDDSSENSYTPPLMKVCGTVSGTIPQGLCPAPCLEVEGGAEGVKDFEAADNGIPNVPVTPSADTQLVTPTNPTERALGVADSTLTGTAGAESAVDLKRLGRLTRLKVEAKSYALKTARQQALHEKRFFSREERERRETIAKMEFLWNSGEPVLMDEVRVWALVNPGILPEAINNTSSYNCLQDNSP